MSLIFSSKIKEISFLFPVIISNILIIMVNSLGVIFVILKLLFSKISSMKLKASFIVFNGNLVIIDNDYIYDEEEYFKNNYLAPSDYFYEFEERYRAEYNNVK